MKRLPVKIVIPAVFALLACCAHAQNIKPGQWELSNKIKSANAQTNQAMTAMMQQLANLPPDQRAQIEAMMAQSGAGAPKLSSSGGIVLTACITPEMAARQEVPTGQNGHCKSNNQVVPGGMNVSFNCTDPASSGEGHLQFKGDSAFVMTMDVSTEARGKPEQMTVETSGRWLSSSCPASPR